MTFNYELVNKIVEAIFPLPDKFGTIDDCGDTDEDPTGYDDIYNAAIKIDKDIQIEYGITKLVITSPNFGGVVIKIPFNGYFVRYNQEEEDFTWCGFCYAEGTDCSDYCLSEYEKYCQLKARGLSCFITKTVFFRTICGVRVFLQEYVIPENDDYEVREPSLKSLRLADKWRKERKFYMIDSEWVANCLDKYGESKTEKFLNYCNTVDPSILEDAHCGNYGYRPNGTPCILDFSNFLD